MLEYLRKFTVSFTFYSNAGSVLTGISTGIGPEVFGWKTADGSSSGSTLTAEQEAYYQVIQNCKVLCYTQQLKPSPEKRLLPIQRRRLLLPQARGPGIKLLCLASYR